MTASEMAISVRDLSKIFGKSLFRRATVRALNGVSLDVPKGQVFALLGPNGAGKTTLIKILLGIIKRSGGQATLLGFPAGDRRGRQRVGYLPEQLKLPRHQSARTALEFYGRLSGVSYADIRRRSDQILEMVGLDGRDKESVKGFSKGMQQRLGLAQALLHEPDLLVLDEPTDGLDPVGRSQIRSILVQLRDAGKTVFVNSHLLQEVELVCDRVAIMNHGLLRFVGTIDDLNPKEESAVELELIGDHQKIADVLAEFRSNHAQIDQLNVNDHGNCVLIYPTKQQSDADGLLDHFRQRGISILRLRPKRKTLEDAFLELIKDQAAVA